MNDLNLTTDARAPDVVTPAFVPGVVVAGRYRLESRLGAGGGGTVWRAFDQQLDAVVALKIVSADGDLERWRREVAMARRIADRNVCRVHDLGEAGDVRFVTMELVEGTSLRAKIGPHLPAAEACALVQQVVAGTAAIHAAGVVHRDLKPENIVVATDGRAVIVDFGLAREPTQQIAHGPTVVMRSTPRPSPSATVTDAGAIVGTPRYMSPEQAAGDIVDARTDVWALGLIAHELLAGTLPAPDPHGRAIALPVDAKWPGSSAILHRCLALLPDERFGDARAVQAALAATRRGRWVRRVANALALAGIAGALALAHALVRVGPPAAAAPPVAVRQLLDLAPKQWPDDAPLSIALAPDGHRFAYTTGGGKLLVRDLLAASTDAVAWPTPKIERPALRALEPPELRELVTLWTAGWFSDDSLGVVGTTREGEYLLFRVWAGGKYQLLYRHPQRMTAAVSPVGDRVAIGIRDYALFVLSTGEHPAPDQIATLDHGEHVTAIAWSPDGARLACMRAPADPHDDARLQVLTAGGGDMWTLWQGSTTTAPDQLLAWIDDGHLVFGQEDRDARRTALFTVAATKDHAPAQERYSLGAASAGVGSAARGVLVFLRRTTTEAVQVSARIPWRPQPVHERGQRAHHIAGWTADDHVVFLAGDPNHERIVRGAPNEVPVPWPGTSTGDVPDTLVDDRVIVHRVDAAARMVAIAAVDRAGARHELARLSLAMVDPTGTPIRCAADRTQPCVLEELSGGEVRYVRFDPATGARGERIHARGIRERFLRSMALSADGRQLAIVDGTDQVTVIDTESLEQRTLPAGDGAELQSLAFAPDGDLWATSLGLRGRLFGLMKFDRLTSGRLSTFAGTEGGTRGDVLRWFWRPTIHADGKRVAFATRELYVELWRADGL